MFNILNEIEHNILIKQYGEKWILLFYNKYHY